MGEGKHEVVGEWSPKEPAGDGGQEAEGTTWSEEEDGFREVLTLPVPSESLVSFSEDSVRRRLGPVSLASLAVYKLSTVVRIECRKLSTAICCRSQGSCVATEVRRSRPAMSRALPASVSIVSNVSKATRLIQPNLDKKKVKQMYVAIAHLSSPFCRKHPSVLSPRSSKAEEGSSNSARASPPSSPARTNA